MEAKVTFETQDKVRTFGGWYRHIIVKVDGVRA